MILNLFKKIFAVAGTVLMLLLLSPLIFAGMLYVGIHSFWRFSFRKLRRDPNMKLQQLVTGPITEDLDGTQIMEVAVNYFDQLTNAIAEKSSAKTSRLARSSKSGEALSLTQNTTTITFVKELTTQTVSIRFELCIDESRDADGDVMYESPYDGDDFTLAGDIHAYVKLNNTVGQHIIRMQYDQVAAHFCIAALSGRVRYNSETGQLWALFDDEKTWMVLHKLSQYDEVGFRESYHTGKARLNWFDG